MISKEVFNSGAQERGGITLETVAYNLYRCRILDWETPFGMTDWELELFRTIGHARVRIIRGFQADVNAHKREYVNAGEHVITESPKGNLKTSQGIVVDGMEVPFISSEVEYMIKEMLDGSPMSKDEYVEDMKRRGFEDPERIIGRNIGFLNKYFHLGLKLQEEKTDGVDNYFLEIPETTKIKFGQEPTRQ